LLQGSRHRPRTLKVKATSRAKAKARIKAKEKANTFFHHRAKAKIKAMARTTAKASALPTESHLYEEHHKDYHPAVPKPMLNPTHRTLSAISVMP
jgi:hypothetical protein